ncbi:MAG: LysE family transporter [bacterium]
MHYTLFLVFAYLLGCVAAVPSGPVQIEVVRRSINGHIKAALAVIGGAFLVDLLYGGIAFFGIAPFLEETKVMAFFWLFGGALLTLLGIFIIRNTMKDPDSAYSGDYLKRKRWGFLGGLSLSATNPVMVLWWLSGARLLGDIGLIKDFTTDVAVAFLIAGSLGLASYLAALSLIIAWAKKFLSVQKLRRINLFFGVFLLVIALYFVGTSISTLFG